MRASLLATLLTMASAVAQTPSSDVSVGVFPFLEGNMDSRISEIVRARRGPESKSGAGQAA